MTVEELIGKLQKLDPSAEVIIASSNPELNGSNVSVTYVHQWDDAESEVRTFRDMMDGETFQRVIWLVCGDGDRTVVSIG